MEDFFYKGIWRMDWGFGNPNTTAALIVTLMVAVWALALVRPWGFWLALFLFTGLGVCLIHTFSRGGMIALFAGLVPLALFAPRPWPWSRIIAVTTAVWIMIGCSVYLNAHERYGQGVIKGDRSISNRLALWKSAPQMIVDAPRGWGFHRAAKSYMQWYQPLDREERYRTFVNSHLEWLIEFGWPWRFLYLFTWFGILLLCWPVSRHSWMAIPLGIWGAFAVAAFFSSVAESPWLWILPGTALVIVLFRRWREGCWPSSILWSIPAAISLMVLSGLFLYGKNERKLEGSPGAIVIGEGKPSVWLVADPKVLGEYYGRTLRRYLQSSKEIPESLGIVESMKSLPDTSGNTVILTGTFDEEEKRYLVGLSKKASELILVTPSFFPQELELSSGDKLKIQVIVGELAQPASVSMWKNFAEIRTVEGVGTFFPNWPELLMGKKSKVRL